MLHTSLQGRVDNTKLAPQHALLPLFEAVVNSIFACEQNGTGDTARIQIRMTREEGTASLVDGSISSPVHTFEIIDNGMGFTDANYNSFLTADSRLKSLAGGKGIGRFLWLKAFDRAEIASTFYDETTSTAKERSFILALTDDGIEGHSLKDSQEEVLRTSVKLVGFKKPYIDKVPKSAEVIASRIIEHCLEYLVLGHCPSIDLVDCANNITINLNAKFSAEVQGGAESLELKIAGRELTIHHLKIKARYADSHRIYFCADQRNVLSEKLEGRIPNLSGSLKDEDGSQFLYCGYVSGKYLDQSVNPERTAFVMPEESELLGDPTWNEVTSKIDEVATSFLSPYTTPLKIEKDERIKTYINTKAQGFRPLLKHKPKLLESIPHNLSDEKLDVELYKRYQVYEGELREQGSKLLKTIEDGTEADLAQGYAQFLEEWNEDGMAKLASHVVHRKTTLKLLRASLALNKQAKYSLEDAIHGLVFPLKKTSEDVSADKMNLWVIDEKLAFHNYLASDIPFRQMKEDILAVDSLDRPDIIIFDQPAAFVDDDAPYSSVVIVEFKRPARNDYSDSENPIAQVYGYVRKIRNGKATDRAGRPISVPGHTRFYAYVLADLTETLKTQAENARLQLSSDGSGYFGFNDQVGVYVELVSYDKLVTDAERRNAYFFQQLGVN